jgi:glucose-6-phosphate 1-dehydrogenase
MRREELERQWWIAEPLLEAWRSSDELPVAHLAGSRGPSTTDALLAPRDAWRPI